MNFYFFSYVQYPAASAFGFRPLCTYDGFLMASQHLLTPTSLRVPNAERLVRRSRQYQPAVGLSNRPGARVDRCGVSFKDKDAGTGFNVKHAQRRIARPRQRPPFSAVGRRPTAAPAKLARPVFGTTERQMYYTIVRLHMIHSIKHTHSHTHKQTKTHTRLHAGVRRRGSPYGSRVSIEHAYATTQPGVRVPDPCRRVAGARQYKASAPIGC